jgi:hypothetical protein
VPGVGAQDDNGIFANENNILRMAIKSGEVDLANDDDVLRELLIQRKCREYRVEQRNDFTFDDWLAEQREELLAEVEKLKFDGFPTKNDFIQVNVINLAQYDEDTQSFPLTQESRLRSVGFLPYNYNYEADCDYVRYKRYYTALPHNILIRLELPLNLFRLPVSEALGKRLVNHFNQQNRDREVYTRTYFTIKDFFERNPSSESREGLPLYNLSYIGRINKIEFYVRGFSNRPVKTLYYDTL